MIRTAPSWAVATSSSAGRRGRSRRRAGAALLTAGLLTLLLLATGLARGAQVAAAEASPGAPGDPAQALTALAAVVGAVLSGWLALSLALAAVHAAVLAPRHSAAAVEPATGRRSATWRRIVAHITAGLTPMLLRVMVATLLGVGTSAALAGSTMAATGGIPRAAVAQVPAAVPDTPNPDSADPAECSPPDDLAASWSPPPPPPPPQPGWVRVRAADTLWRLAAHRTAHPDARQVAAAWPRWYAINRDRIGPDPDHLTIGLRLRVPAAVADQGALR